MMIVNIINILKTMQNYKRVKDYIEGKDISENKSRFSVRRFKKHYEGYYIKDNQIYTKDHKLYVSPDEIKKTLRLEYLDPKSMCNGQNSFFNLINSKYAGISFKDCKEFLSEQRPYQLHKQPQKLRIVNPIIEKKPKIYVQIDTMNLEEFSHPNNGYSYCLTVIDIFSKFAWAFPLKNLKAKETAEKFKEVLKDCPDLKIVQSDNGTEFAAEFESLLESKGIKHQFSRSHTPQSQGQIERFNRTLKSLIFQYFTLYNTKVWVPVLPSLTENYNSRYHSTIKAQPNKIINSTETKQTYENIVNAGKNKLTQQKKYFQDIKKGDKVRILNTSISAAIRKAKLSGIGKQSKSFIKQWSDDVYTVLGIIKVKTDVNHFNLYKIDMDGTIVKLRNDELQLIPNNINQDNLHKKDLEKYGISFTSFKREK